MGLVAKGAGSLEKRVMGHIPAGWQIQAGTGSSGGLLGWVTFISNTRSLILAESRVATSPEQHFCPHPGQQVLHTGARGSPINSGLSGEPDACILPARRTLRRSVSLGKGPWLPWLLRSGGHPRLSSKRLSPSPLRGGGQAKSQTLTVQLAHL